MRTVRANGLSFAYLDAGAGPLVLLVHGFPDTAHSWEPVLPALAAAGFRAVAINTRGYFPTQVPADGAYDGETLGRDLLAIIEALGEAQAIVVGHDFGATAAYSAAGLAPERIRQLVTLAIPHPSSLAPSLRLLWGLRHFFWLGRKAAPARLRATGFSYLDVLVRRWSPSWTRLSARDTAEVKAAFNQPGCVEAACAYYAAISPRPPRSLRAPIAVPTVCFAGEDDRLMTPASFERARRRFTGPYQVVTMPGGHFLHREHPERFITELLRVLPGARRE